MVTQGRRPFSTAMYARYADEEPQFRAPLVSLLRRMARAHMRTPSIARGNDGGEKQRT